MEAADGGDVPVINDKVDISAVADEEIILSAPINFLCDENCTGIEIKKKRLKIKAKNAIIKSYGKLAQFGRASL